MAKDRESAETPEQTLARLQAAASPGGQVNPASQTSGARYSPPLPLVRFREGYAIDQVDAFLDRSPRCTPEEVRDARFSTVRLIRGYDEDVVDALLDDVVAWLSEGADVRRRIAGWRPSDRLPRR
jgi:DivIVA domain-containing protein